MDSRPVGVFDSGVGGLTVLHECLVTMPHEDFVYLGDHARLPYGPRPLEEIRRFARWLKDSGRVSYVAATDEEALLRAGVDRARGVIAALGSDKDNLIVTVLVKQKNSQIRIVARCSDLKFADKLKRAGADSTVSPNRIGGLRLASEVLRPNAVSFLDLMLKEHAHTLRIEEVRIATSSWVGKQIHQLQLKQKYNILLLAVKDQGSTFFANPPDDFSLKQGTVLIVMGETDSIRRASADADQRVPQI